MDSRRRAILAAGLGVYASRVLPQGTVKLPKIGLGTWQTFDVGNDSAARTPLREVLQLLDGNVVDSSPMYGSSESVAGDLIAELGMRHKLFIATKVWTSGRGWSAWTSCRCITWSTSPRTPRLCRIGSRRAAFATSASRTTRRPPTP